MSQSDAPAVSIVRCNPYDSLEAVKPCVKRAVDLIGGLESLIMPGDTVLLKPNLVNSRDYTSGATTNPFVVEAVAELCKEAKAKRIVIADGSAIGSNTKEAFENCGLNAVAERLGAELVDFTDCEFDYYVNPLAKKMKRIRLPRVFMEANVVINLPVMKTHDALEISLGLKNMKGLLQSDDKRRFHKWGLAQAIVDLDQIAMPELTITDGTVAMEGMGLAFGKPVGLGLVLASKDTCAVDRVAMEIMGYELDEVEYIKLAGESGLGCTDLSQIEVLGESIADVKRPFERNTVDRDVLREYNIKLVGMDSCSGCANAISSLLSTKQLIGQMDTIRDTVFLYGQSVKRLPEEDTEGMNIVRVGSCTRDLDGYGLYYPGCPPWLYRIADELNLNKNEE